MTISNAIKTVEKQLKVTPTSINGRHYEVQVNGHVLSFHKNSSNDIDLIHTRRVNDVSDSYSDYFAGSFWSTINKAIKYGLN